MIVYLNLFNWFTIKMKLQKHKQLLEILLDNEFHSGEQIGQQLKMSRAGVWKLVQSLQTLGFEIQGISRRGYQLTQQLSFLSLSEIKNNLTPSSLKLFKTIELFDEIDSTNTYLMQRMYEFTKIPRVCLAEQQTFGRGRRERPWHSPYAQNIYLSILWRLESQHELHALPLIICLAIVKVLEKISLPDKPQLKWPNDVYYQGKKLAGVLIETHSEVNETTQIVIGIGLNVNMQNASKKVINQAWTSLTQIFNKNIDRNYVVAQLIEATVLYLEIYRQHGFSYFKDLWNKYDLCYKKISRIQCHDLQLEGIAEGVDQNGKLQISISKNKKINVGVGEIASSITTLS